MGDGRPARSGLTFESTVIAPRRSGGLLPQPAASRMPHISSTRLADLRGPITLWPPAGTRRGLGRPRSQGSLVRVFPRLLGHPASRPALECVGELEILPKTLPVSENNDVLAAAERLGLVAVDRDLVDLQVDLLAPLDLVGRAGAVDFVFGQAGAYLA